MFKGSSRKIWKVPSRPALNRSHWAAPRSDGEGIWLPGVSNENLFNRSVLSSAQYTIKGGLFGPEAVFDGSTNTADTGISSSVSSAGVTLIALCRGDTTGGSPASTYDGPLYSGGAGLIWNHANTSYNSSFYIKGDGSYPKARFSPNPLAANTWYILSGSVFAGSLSAYTNGILTDSTSSGLGVGSDFGNYRLGHNLNGVTPEYFWAGSIALALKLDRGLSPAEMYALCASPDRLFGLLKNQSRTVYSFPSAAGGATYDGAVSESLAAATTQGVAVDWLGTAAETLAVTSAQGVATDWLGAVAETAALTTTHAGTMLADVAVTMALTVTTTEAGALDTTQTVSESLAIVTAQAQDGAITLTVAESLGLVSAESVVASMGVTLSEALAIVSEQAGTADIAAAIAEAITLVVDQWVAGSTFDVDVSETLAATTTLAVTVDFAGVISEALAAQSSVSVTSTENAAVAELLTIVDATVGGLVSTLSVTEAVTITTAQSGAIVTAEFKTPDGRTLRITFDARTLRVVEDERTLFINSTMH